MVGLANIDKVVFEIKKAMLNNEKIRKLLYNVGPDALSAAAPSIQLVDGHIYENPTVYFTDENTLKKNNFIVVYIPNLSFEGNSTIIDMNIDIFVNQDLWLLDDNRIRLHQLLSEVTKSVHEKKFGAAGKVLFRSAQYTVIGENFNGFQINIEILEEPIENAI